MKKGEKTQRTLNIERIAEFFLLQPETVEKKLNEETKTSNMHVKKALENISNGLPYYDMNAILYEVCKEVSKMSNHTYRFICSWSVIEYDINYSKRTQSLECWTDGKQYFTKRSGIDGINDILNQIGFEGYRLQEPKNFLELVVWSRISKGYDDAEMSMVIANLSMKLKKQ